MRHVPDGERRARLAVRHALAPAHRADTPEAATRSLTALHATEPVTPYLSCRARVDGFRAAELDRALYEDRSLVRQLAMRRTLFVLPRDLLPAAWPSASARVAASERVRLTKDVATAGLAEDGDAWVRRARAAVLAVLAEAPGGLTATEVRAAVPMVDVRLDVAGGGTWAAPRVLTHLGATGDVVRGADVGGWRTAQARWTTTRAWLGEELAGAAVPAPGDVPGPASTGDAPASRATGDAPAPGTTDGGTEPTSPLHASAGYRELVRRWLFSFGPGTEEDLVWWLGATKGAVRDALAGLEAVEVSLDRGGRGWLLPDDLEPQEDPGPWVALLPVLDPTVMGWKDRRFFLGGHHDRLFDDRGNAGTTAWVDGRVVGCWIQDDEGVVRLRLLGRVGERRRRRLEREAARLTDWLDGVRIGTVYRSPAMRAEG